MNNNFLQSLVDRLEKLATIKTVYGDPIEREGRVIIPVARVAFGAGGGVGSSGSSSEGSQDGEETSKAAHSPSEGQGGGAGGMVSPVGVLEITPEETVFIPINILPRLLKAAVIGLLIGIWLGKRLK